MQCLQFQDLFQEEQLTVEVDPSLQGREVPRDCQINVDEDVAWFFLFVDNRKVVL